MLSLVTDPAPRPSGIVTLLFTDVQGSTRLWEAEPDQMAAALRRHDAILRAAIEQAGGHVFKTVGDAFCAAFAGAAPAVACVLAAQRALASESWPTSRPIRVRMSLHTGSCEERDHDYFGPVVNRTARLEAIAHGGQVLISGATAGLLAGSLPAGASLRDLGLHRLKDLGRPEQVFQLEAGDLAADFPPLTSLDNPDLPNNLPGQLSAFVGRSAELAQVRELASSTRLVTLTGAGGSGKTRLALQAAAELVGAAPDGVWLAELAAVTDGSQVPGVLAGALGLADGGGAAPAQAVTDALAGQDTLVLLDNCEHVIDAAARLCDQLLRHCPKIRIVATSREPLGIDGEQVYRVPSLSLPPADADAGELLASDAVLLFTERARAHDPGFALDAATAPLVASVCRRLDGIPLALELAAARLASMSVSQVSQRLDQRFRLLTGGSRNAMPRQQTLLATVDWSFSLLTPADRDILTRLAVFSGGFALEAAEQVCTTSDTDELAVLDSISSLVGKSLVIADHASDSVRYRMLETIRQYCAQELLRTSGDDAVLQLRNRHAAYFAALAESSEPGLRGRDQGTWLRRLDLEWDNLRAALAHLQAEGDTASTLRASVALRRFGISRGHADLLRYLRAAVDAAGSAPSALTASALVVTGDLTQLLDRSGEAELAVARQYAERGLAMARQAGDQRTEMQALGVLAESAYIRRDLDSLRQLAGQAVAIARQTGDPQLIGEQLQMLASASETPEEQRRIRLEVLEYARQSGDDMIVPNQLHHLYGLELAAGRPAEAGAFLEQAIVEAERLNADMHIYILYTDLCVLRLIQGRPQDAAPAVRRGLLTARRIGHTSGLGQLIFAAACCAAWRGDYPAAARLHGASRVHLARAMELGVIRMLPVEDELRDRELRRLGELMGDGPLAEGIAAGAALSLQQASDLALGRG
jgi:predicted ATPase/class 3 adenylate cyclase